MDMDGLGRKLGLAEDNRVIRKAEELRRLSNVHFDSSTFGVGEVCKSVLCFELATTKLQVPFDRQKAIRLSGMSEKAYTRSLNAMQNALGVRPKLDIRELGIQFGCLRLIGSAQRALSLYKERFVAALPESRRSSADFGRPVFTAVAFYLCARRNKLKVDRTKLIEICGTSDSEFSNVATSMNDLCFDVVGIAKEKKDPRSVKNNRELLDALPSKRIREDEAESDDSGESIDDGDELEVPGLKRRKKIPKHVYEEWKDSVLTSNKVFNDTGLEKKTKQLPLSFVKKPAQTVRLQGS
ncbi:hypothetical protein SUGI_0900840 [Cryptomeria japonica]|uniref:origin of replication complex subunit 6 n=1 Tax=Cryptomeria japonica TaxID=3369 RepID=UPI0024149DF3|nr:origin of replication complex subunit 6 [Cryptomeria japonica]GLJ43363.1 hypothetical protein SUGI_0900840 [Cryptomeria japonica]